MTLRDSTQETSSPSTETLEAYRIVICFAMSPPLPVTPPSLDIADAEPGFFSNIFQNLRLSSAARTTVSLVLTRVSQIFVTHLLLQAFGHQGSSNCEEL